MGLKVGASESGVDLVWLRFHFEQAEEGGSFFCMAKL